MKAIRGAVSFETAHYIDDYPCGFTARCHKTMWIETKPGHGQRGVYATTSKHNISKWCAPKASTYSELVGIAIVEASDVDDKKYTAESVGHAVFMHITSYGDVAFIERFNRLFGPFDTDYERKTMRKLLAESRAEERLGEWNPPPGHDYFDPATRAAREAYENDRYAKRDQYRVEELAKIKANDEVPEPEPEPVKSDFCPDCQCHLGTEPHTPGCASAAQEGMLF